jgi:hypothetical protein
MSSTSEKSGRLEKMYYVDQESGYYFTLGQLHRSGRLGSTNRLSRRFQTLGLPPEIYQSYLDKLADFIPNAKRRAFGSPGREWEQIAIGGTPVGTCYERRGASPAVLIRPL